jgi:hypothetical protein
MERKDNKKEESNPMKQLTLQAAFGIKKRGRPKRASLPTDHLKKRAPKPHVASHVASNFKKRKTAPAIAKTTSKVIAKRTNWGTGKNLEILKVAVDEWKNKTGRYFDSNGEPVTLSRFCNLVSIPYPTFCKYVTENGKIQREIGKSVGHPPSICAEDQATIVDVIARYDRGNDGGNVSNCIDITMEIGGLKGYTQCTLARKRASGIFQRIRAKHCCHRSGTVQSRNTRKRLSALLISIMDSPPSASWS